MDYGSTSTSHKNGTRFDLLGNRLVLIAPKDFTIDDVTIGPGFDLAALAGTGRVAVGDVRAVPAGLYAKAALEKLGAWAAVEPKLAMAESVRAAMVLVARGEAPLGIVYETDAYIERGVKIVGVFPKLSPADHLSGGADDEREAGGGDDLEFLRTQRRKLFSRATDLMFWQSRRRDRLFLTRRN